MRAGKGIEGLSRLFATDCIAGAAGASNPGEKCLMP